MVKGFYYLYLNRSSPSSKLLTCWTLRSIRSSAGKGVKRVTDYLLQQHHISYISPFSKLVNGNGAPHANSVKLHAVLKYPSESCQWAQQLFGAVAKGNL